MNPASTSALERPRLNGLNGFLRTLYEQKWREASYRKRSPAVDAKDDILRELAELIRYRVRPEPETVVDIGCGTGKFLSVLKDAGYEPTGIDIADNCLDADVFGLPFICSPVTDLPEGMEFDAVVCCDMMEHIPAEMIRPVLVAIRKLSDKAVIGISGIPGDGTLHCSVLSREDWENELKVQYPEVRRAKVTCTHPRQMEKNWFLWRCWA